jgi:hypothetical protein
METWNNFYLQHKGINNINDEYGKYQSLTTLIRDKKTNYNVVEIYTTLTNKTIEFHIGTNEKMIRILKLPFYQHQSTFSYREYKKYFDQKHKKTTKIACLSLGTKNIRMILESILSYWRVNGYDIKKIDVYRETGATINKEGRVYDI